MFVLYPVSLSQTVVEAVSPQSVPWTMIATPPARAATMFSRISHHHLNNNNNNNNRFQLIIVIVVIAHRIITIHHRTIITITIMPSTASLAMTLFSEVLLTWDTIQIVIVNSKIVGILILCESQLSKFYTLLTSSSAGLYSCVA